MRIALQPAFILHQRPYRETSVLLDLLTEEHGRITAVAKGVRTPKSRLRSLLQPFVPLFISWQGKGELMTLLTAEPNGVPHRLMGERLLSGLYLNELLVRLLQKHDPHPRLYTIYYNTLLELQGKPLLQKALRLFEIKLLEELGYGLQLKQDVAQRALVAGAYYRFHHEHGFEPCPEGQDNKSHIMVFSGKSLLSLAEEQLDDEDCLRDAKRLMRLAIMQLLGKNTLNSRLLFRRKVEDKIE